MATVILKHIFPSDPGFKLGTEIFQYSLFHTCVEHFDIYDHSIIAKGNVLDGIKAEW